MQDAIASPGDPLFFLHHAFLDRVWLNWQDDKPWSRRYEISGNNAINLTSPFPYGTPFFAEGLNISVAARPLPAFNGTNQEDVLGAILRHSRPADVPYDSLHDLSVEIGSG
jgi:hypothetical protein